MAVVKGEYRLWHRKWQAIPIADRPQTVLVALDHCTPIRRTQICRCCFSCWRLFQWQPQKPSACFLSSNAHSQQQETQWTNSDWRRSFFCKSIAATRLPLTPSFIDLLQQRRDVLTLFYKILLVGLYIVDNCNLTLSREGREWFSYCFGLLRFQ